MIETRRTQREIQAFLRYRKSEICSIFDCYKRPSEAKAEIEIRIHRFMTVWGGYDYRVISSNQMQFTAGFLYRDEFGKLWFYYWTKSKVTKTPLDEPI